jgi:hypothetical protein
MLRQAVPEGLFHPEQAPMERGSAGVGARAFAGDAREDGTPAFVAGNAPFANFLKRALAADTVAAGAIELANADTG